MTKRQIDFFMSTVPVEYDYTFIRAQLLIDIEIGIADTLIKLHGGNNITFNEYKVLANIYRNNDVALSHIHKYGYIETLNKYPEYFV